jgi:peroxiredoxin
MTSPRSLLSLAIAWSCAFLLSTTTSAAEPDVKVGDTIANCSFKDIRYLPRSLDDFPKAKAFVLVFANTGCPLAQRYLPALKDLDKDYRDKGVQLLLVNVGADDTIMAMAAHAVRHEIEFPSVKDSDGSCVHALGVRRTPEAVVLDAEHRLRYRGRIDDQYRLGGTRPAPTRRDLQEALEAVLAGRDVAVKETPVDGCPITLPKAPEVAATVTFAEHVAPLLQKHCQTCHRPGTAAPFALISYRQVSARADAIAEVIAEQRMPPWYASPEHGTFINRRGMTATERDLILQWVRAGTPRGDEAKFPPRPLPPKEAVWRIGKPDLVLQTVETYELPADGDVPYKYAVLPTLFLDDTWIRALEIRPDNPRVLHHANIAFITAGEGFKQSNFITGFVPGGEPMDLDEGVAFCIPRGAALGLQIHFVTTGKEEKCRLSVGIRYAGGAVHKQLRHMLLADHRFAIPPGAPAHRVEASQVLDCDTVGVGLFAHMHLRGKDMTFRAIQPDGSNETLLMVPNYSFDWQMPYRWEPGKMRLPKGTRLECVAHYDNSTFNPYNPDPTATVRDGQMTHQEMMNGFFFYTDEGEDLGLDVDAKTGHVRPKEKK